MGERSKVERTPSWDGRMGELGDIYRRSLESLISSMVLHDKCSELGMMNIEGV